MRNQTDGCRLSGTGMAALCWRAVGCTIALAAVTSASNARAATIYDVQLPLNQFGHVDQNSPGINAGGCACGPTAAINSFVYLANEFPDFGGTLIPDYDMDGTPGYLDDDDLIQAVNELAGPNYMNQGAGGTSDTNWVTGKRKWLNDKAPGKIRFKGIDDQGAGGLTMGIPDWKFLYGELKDEEDVEIGFTWGMYDGNGVWQSNGGHWLTATSFHFEDTDMDMVIDATEMATVDFIDPWGGVELVGTLEMGPDGFLKLSYMDGAAGPAGAMARIDIIGSESPVPEPATLLLLGVALMMIPCYRARRR